MLYAKNSGVVGIWTDIHGGETTIYHDDRQGFVVGYYDVKNQEPIKFALALNKDGSAVLQTHDGGQYEFTKLNPEKVAEKLIDFLSCLESCKE